MGSIGGIKGFLGNDFLGKSILGKGILGEKGILSDFFSGDGLLWIIMFVLFFLWDE